MKEAPPPGSSPSPDQLAEYDAVMQHEANGELSLAPDAGRDMPAAMRAMDAVAGRPVKMTIETDPIGDAIAQEVEKINALTGGNMKSTEVSDSTSEHGAQEAWNDMQALKGIKKEDVPDDAQQKIMGYFAQRNAALAASSGARSMNPLARAKNAVSGITGRIGDKMAEWGGQIEAGEEERAMRDLEREKERKSIEENGVVAHEMQKRADAYARWSQGAEAPRTSQTARPRESAPERPVARMPVAPRSEVFPPRGPAETRSRELWGMTGEPGESQMNTDAQIASLERQLAELKKRKTLESQRNEARRAREVEIRSLKEDLKRILDRLDRLEAQDDIPPPSGASARLVA